VGYPSTPKLWQRSASSVQSIFASLMFFSFNVVAASSYSGARALQCPLSRLLVIVIEQVALRKQLTTRAELQNNHMISNVNQAYEVNENILRRLKNKDMLALKRMLLGRKVGRSCESTYILREPSHCPSQNRERYLWLGKRHLMLMQRQRGQGPRPGS